MWRSILRNPAWQAELERAGFVKVPLLDAAEIDSLRHDLSSVRDREFRTSTIVGQHLSYHSTALDPEADYRIRTFELVRGAVTQPLGRLLDGFDIVTAGVINKASGTGILPLHCDWTMTENPDDVTITVWCPLVDVNESNGCLHVVPGSHRLVRHVRGPGIKNYHMRIQQELKTLAIPVPMRAGEAVVFETSLLHGSPINGSVVDRPALMISCVPASNRPVFYRDEDQHKGQTFEMFDASDGAFREHSPADYFAGLVADKLIARLPNENRYITWNGFRRRRAVARLLRRFSGRHDLYKLFERLPGFA